MKRLDSKFIIGPHSRLFSVYSEPEGGLVRSSAVLLLYPGDQEYKMVHWAYRSLATHLAKAGWPVLRFDYTGTGDSAGETGTGNLDLWLKDAEVAADYLRLRSGCLHIQVVGVRLGVFVAARLSRSRKLLNTVLWDAPVSGAGYLADLANLESGQRAVDRFSKIARPASNNGFLDWTFGFPMPIWHKDMIGGLNWANEQVRSTYCHSLITSGGAGGIHVLGSRCTTVDEALGWGSSTKAHAALLVPQCLKAIAGIIGRPQHD